MNLTSKQWFQIVSGIISGLITGAALLQDLFGNGVAIKVVAFLGIANIILSSVGAAVSGQANLVTDVTAMKGVEHININAQANPTLAALAIDPDQPKVGAINPAVREVLRVTANGGAA